LDRGDLQLAEEGSVFCSTANQNELNLCENEAVSAAMFPHGMVQSREATEVFNSLDISLNSHSGVEAIEASDKPNNSRQGFPTKDSGSAVRFSGDICDKQQVLDVAGGFGWNRELQGPVGGYSKGRVELWQIV
jgi:hypothetical protein